jgi:cytidylate kinase
VTDEGTGERTVVAIDGPAGSGKSSVARALAARLGVPYLDTGAMYRALGLLALERGVDPDDRAAAAGIAAAASLALRLGAEGGTEVWLDGAPVDERIRSSEVGAVTSRLAVHPEVRARLVTLQREFVGRHGGVLEGRDIGTRVVPETRCKFFLDAEPEVRAGRRLAELRDKGVAVDPQALGREIAERDARDRSRPESPLAPAPDAVRVDTTGLSLDEVVERLERLVRRRRVGSSTDDSSAPSPGGREAP